MSRRADDFEFTLSHITVLMHGATPEQLEALRRAWSLVHHAEQLEPSAGASFDPRTTALDGAKEPAPRGDVEPVVVHATGRVVGHIVERR